MLSEAKLASIRLQLTQLGFRANGPTHYVLKRTHSQYIMQVTLDSHWINTFCEWRPVGKGIVNVPVDKGVPYIMETIINLLREKEKKDEPT